MLTFDHDVDVQYVQMELPERLFFVGHIIISLSVSCYFSRMATSQLPGKECLLTHVPNLPGNFWSSISWGFLGYSQQSRFFFFLLVLFCFLYFFLCCLGGINVKQWSKRWNIEKVRVKTQTTSQEWVLQVCIRRLMVHFCPRVFRERLQQAACSSTHWLPSKTCWWLLVGSSNC